MIESLPWDRKEGETLSTELNEKIALAMGWRYDTENEKWFNHYGAQINHLPDFMGSRSGIESVVDYFRSITKDEFFSEFHPKMSPEQVCKLTLKALKK